MSNNYTRLSNEYNKVENGTIKMIAIEKAIQLVEKEKDYECTLRLKEDYIRQSIFYDDSFKAFIMFPEYLKFYDEHLDCGYSAYDMLWTYKWILGGVREFYQISHENALKYFEDFKKRCIENGYSLRAYFYRLSSYMEDINIKEYKKISLKYLEFKRDSICDCETCELNREIYYELNYGSFKKAMKKAEPILSGQKKCFQVPFITYENILYYYIEKNDIENGSIYEKLLLKSMKKTTDDISVVGTLLEYYTISNNINTGIKLFKTNLKFYSVSKNPKSKFYFGVGVIKFLKHYKENSKKETIKLLLNKGVSLYEENGIYSIDNLINYFKTDITDIANKFDKRNKNNFYINIVEK